VSTRSELSWDYRYALDARFDAISCERARAVDIPLVVDPLLSFLVATGEIIE